MVRVKHRKWIPCLNCGTKHQNTKFCSSQCANKFKYGEIKINSSCGSIEFFNIHDKRIGKYKFEKKSELIELLESYNGFGGYCIVNFKDAGSPV